MNFSRVWAVVLRHIFLSIHQLDRIADLFLFPVFSIILWGLFSTYFGINTSGILVFFWINIVIFAVSLGIFNVAIVVRYGSTIGPLTWILPFILQPFVAVFYPVSVLPPILQKIVWFVPLTHVFEGMRGVLKNGTFDSREFIVALGLNVVYFIVAVCFFAYIFNLARKKGSIVKL